jgi:hypothetical protein
MVFTDTLDASETQAGGPACFLWREPGFGCFLFRQLEMRRDLCL